MKNFILVALLAAALFFGWQKFALDYLPKQIARDFVEELRLQMDNGVFSRQFTFVPPLPEKQLTLPPEGIAATFRLDKESGPVTISGKRTITYLVGFEKSPVAAAGRDVHYEYRLILTDEGSLLIPKWKTSEFKPTTRRGILAQ